ncbi:MAG: hypothetical protein WCP97_07390 [bacterium]
MLNLNNFFGKKENSAQNTEDAAQALPPLSVQPTDGSQAPAQPVPSEDNLQWELERKITAPDDTTPVQSTPEITPYSNAEPVQLQSTPETDFSAVQEPAQPAPVFAQPIPEEEHPSASQDYFRYIPETNASNTPLGAYQPVDYSADHQEIAPEQAPSYTLPTEQTAIPEQTTPTYIEPTTTYNKEPQAMYSQDNSSSQQSQASSQLPDKQGLVDKANLVKKSVEDLQRELNTLYTDIMREYALLQQKILHAQEIDSEIQSVMSPTKELMSNFPTFQAPQAGGSQ